MVVDSLDKSAKILLTGAAGLLGQNLTTCLVDLGYRNITVLDKHQGNLDILQQRHPQVQCVQADLSKPGPWELEFEGKDRLFLLQAQITGDTFELFERNTIKSTENVLAAARDHTIPFTVFIGSSVVNSVADDNYTRSKREQERMMRESGLAHCIARPTLMFGWFDPKHLGWLSRFMERYPVYPIPGHGRYMRQPLYVQDFCRVLIWCVEHCPNGKIYDIVGCENIDYIDIIRTIKRVKKLRTIVLPIPITLFRSLLRLYAAIIPNPPFVADQLDALTAGDVFFGEDMEKTFGIKPTPFSQAIDETFSHPEYSKIILERWI